MTDLLSISLQCAVPLWQMQLQQRPWNLIASRAPELCDVIAHKGDVILFKSKKKGETAGAFNALAEAIALLSFFPGGVNIFGQRWEAEHSGMPKNFRVEASYGRKITDGDFGSMQFHAGISCDLEPGDDRDKVYTELWKAVKHEVIEKVKKVKERLQGKD